jgi:hypothetical protein
MIRGAPLPCHQASEDLLTKGLGNLQLFLLAHP